MADQRDDLTWVVLELTHLGEVKVEEGTLEGMLRRELSLEPDHPIFIPATTFRKDGKVVTVHLMEGYAFVASGLAEVEYLALEHMPYVNQVMTTVDCHGMRVMSVISNARVKDMKVRLRKILSEGIDMGASIRVIDGAYSNLEGTVVGLDDDDVMVRFDLRSLKIVTNVPRVFVEVLSDAGT